MEKAGLFKNFQPFADGFAVCNRFASRLSILDARLTISNTRQINYERRIKLRILRDTITGDIAARIADDSTFSNSVVQRFMHVAVYRTSLTCGGLPNYRPNPPYEESSDLELQGPLQAQSLAVGGYRLALPGVAENALKRQSLLGLRPTGIFYCSYFAKTRFLPRRRNIYVNS